MSKQSAKSSFWENLEDKSFCFFNTKCQGVKERDEKEPINYKRLRDILTSCHVWNLLGYSFELNNNSCRYVIINWMSDDNKDLCLTLLGLLVVMI